MKRLVNKQDCCVLPPKTKSGQDRWWRSAGTLAMSAILAIGDPVGLMMGNQSTALAQSSPPSITPNPNLTINGSCAPNIKIALVLDASASIDPTELTQMKAGILAFLNNLATKAPDRFQVGIVEFAFDADLLQNFTPVNSANVSVSFAPSMNTKFPDRVNNWSPVEIGTFTNWAAGFKKAYDTLGPTNPLGSADLVIFITDGNPNSYLVNGNPFNLTINAVPSSPQAQQAITRTIPFANQWKDRGTKIIAVGVAEVAPSIPANFQGITDSTSTLLFSPVSPNNISTADYLSVSTFDEFGTQISNLANGICANANVSLVKRITAINGVPIDRYRDNTAAIPQAVNDNNIYWPLPLNSNASQGNTNISTFLRGEIDGGQLKPGDTVEYTIYFLNAGGNNANNVRICDRIIGKQTFDNTTSIQLHQGDGTSNFTSVSNLTSASDGDRATLFAAGVSVSNCNLQPLAPGQRDNGAIAIDVTSAGVWSPLANSTKAGTANAYGFVRFTTKVDP